MTQILIYLQLTNVDPYIEADVSLSFVIRPLTVNMFYLNDTCNPFSYLPARQVKSLVSAWIHHVPRYTAAIQLSTKESVVPHVMVRNSFCLSNLFCLLTAVFQFEYYCSIECEYDRREYADGKVFIPAGSGPCLQCRCKASLSGVCRKTVVKPWGFLSKTFQFNLCIIVIHKNRYFYFMSFSISFGCWSSI